MSKIGMLNFKLNIEETIPVIAFERLRLFLICLSPLAACTTCETHPPRLWCAKESSLDSIDDGRGEDEIIRVKLSSVDIGIFEREAQDNP
jgi:hypothetical protein